MPARCADLHPVDAHPRTTCETNPSGGVFLGDEVFNLFRQSRVGGGIEFHAAEWTRIRGGPDERPAFGAEEELARRVLSGPVRQKPEERLEVRGYHAVYSIG